MISAIVIFAGLMLSSGLVLRHKLRIAASAGVPVSRTSRAAATRRANTQWPNQRIGRARPTRRTDPDTQRLMKRLRREELRQKPLEGRN